MKVLALDLGSTLGFASGMAKEGPAKHGVKDFRVNDQEHHGRGFTNESFAHFFDWLHPLVAHVDVIVCEKPLVGMGKFATFHGMRVMFGMYGIVQAVAGGWNRSLLPVSPTTVKKYWTGNGRADKSDMLAEAKKRGLSIKDHNECDAVALYNYYWEVLRGRPIDDSETDEEQCAD